MGKFKDKTESKSPDKLRKSKKKAKNEDDKKAEKQTLKKLQKPQEKGAAGQKINVYPEPPRIKDLDEPMLPAGLPILSNEILPLLPFPPPPPELLPEGNLLPPLPADMLMPGGLLPLPTWIPAKPVTEDDLRCPKCDIVYYSRGSIKNHIQVCKYVRKTGPAFQAVAPQRAKRIVVGGLVKLNKEEKESLKILEKSCFTNDQTFVEDFFSTPNVEADSVKKLYASKEYCCSQCDETFFGIKPFARHLYAHTFVKVGEDEVPTLCGGCGREFDSKEPLKAHLIKDKCTGTIANAKILLRCQLCSLRFCRKENVRKHLRQYAALARPMKDATVFKCHQCPQIFGGQGLLSTHKLVHDNKATHTCEKCSKPFKSRGGLVRHKHLCNGVTQPEGEDAFKCTKCPMKYAKRSSLTVHLRTHSNFSKSLKCSWCKAMFYNEQELKNHVKSHDSQVAREPFCKPCKRSFNNDHNLKLHLWHTHKMTPFQNNVFDEEDLKVGMYDYFNSPQRRFLMPDPNELLPLPDHLLPPVKEECQ